MSNLNRFIIIGLATLASLVLTGCGGPLVIGGKPTYAQNKQDMGGSESSSTTTGPGYKAQTSQSTSLLGYNLGSGKDRLFCYYDQANASSTYRNSQGKTVTQQNSIRRDCRPDPEPIVKPPVVETPPVKALTPTPKDATCGDFRNGDVQGRLVRDCYTKEDRAAGRMSCLRGWEEVWVGGVLQVTGIDSATWNCSPKVAPAQSAVPRAEESRNGPVIPQARRPNYGR